MKKITPFLLIIFLFSTMTNAQEDFSLLWKKVDELEKDNLPKSALKIVEDIYKKAQKAENSPQVIKAMFFKSKYALTLEEEAKFHIVQQFKKQIEAHKSPTKNILQNILANLYWQYFNQNKWKFYNRTQTQVKIDINDFRTWDLTTLFNEIHTHYQASLTHKNELQKKDIKSFTDILHLTEETKTYQPTLFDFLAHNSLDFYKTSETAITKPSYQFKLNDSNLLGDNSSFSKIKLATKDTLSLQFNALKIYQELLSFHLKKKHLTALATVDLQRLAFVEKHGTFSNKEAKLLHALQTARKKFSQHKSSGLYAYEIAKIYHKQAKKFAPKNKQVFRFKNQEALVICKDVLAKYPKSIGAKKCLSLQQKITAVSLSILTEKNIPTNEFSRMLITYRNLDHLNFTIYKVSPEQIRQLNNIHNDKKQFDFIKNLNDIKSWSSNLKNEKDYQTHATEVVIPKLPNGQFVLFASPKKINIEKPTFAYATLQATNLAFIRNNEVSKNYQVIDRKTGKPIEGARVNLSNSVTTHYGKKIDKNFTSNEQGEFTYAPQKAYFANVIATITYKNEKAVFGNFYINPVHEPTNYSPNYPIRTYIFTDRSIYRPGQTIHFKGIALKPSQSSAKVTANKSVIVRLKDVNFQTLKEVTLKTNEFGSFSSKFILPSKGLTGQFTIETSIQGQNYYSYLSVEEYKRPKFETDFIPIKTSNKLNDLVKIKGFAKSYSGATVSNAKVVYRVHRKVQYPKWWYWYRPQFISHPQEITNGETTTDDQGNYTIEFKALPDESINKKQQPIFTYEVSADVTDINGETRSTTTTIKIGYHTLLAEIDMPEILEKQKKTHLIKIHTKNLNNETVNSKGTIQICKLAPPKRILRKRPWGFPDYQSIPKAEFIKKFPHDAYTNEDKFIHWKKSKEVFDTTFNTANQNEIIVSSIKKWESGKYVAILNTKDKYGQAVEAKHYFSVISNADNLPPDNKLLSVTTDKDSYKAGEKAVITVASNATDISVVLFIEKQQKTIAKHYIHLNKNNKKITIPVTDKDLGGFGIKWYYTQYNSFEKGSMVISVPYPTTELQIITKTFRDKIVPNSKQTWSFTITGTKKDQVAAEMLAGMYDASLDAYKEHKWGFSPIKQPLYQIYNSADGDVSFGNESFKIRIPTSNITQPTNSFLSNRAQFNWYGFRFSGYPSRRRFGGGEEIMYSMAPSGRRAARMEQSSAGLEEVVVHDESQGVNSQQAKAVKKSPQKKSLKNIAVRKNLQETAFFYPHLTTDTKGNISFSFTAPEALTKWKLQLLGHTKNLHTRIKTLETVTQKKLMVTPNAPRFLRHGDEIIISTKISNLSGKNLNGTAALILTNPITGKEIDVFKNTRKQLGFSVEKNKNTQVSWKLSIPETLDAVQYKIVAKADNFSDGEQSALPILSNRMLVTETLPLWVRSKQTKTFNLKKLIENKSTTLKNHRLTLEVTSNPAWYAVQALPYLMESQYECSEQIFARYYANTLASYIANSNPRIQEVFNQWRSSAALLSNLEKNQELKSLIIQETPWLRDAQSETDQKKRIALLFEINKLSQEQEVAIQKLAQLQLSNGAFPWFKGNIYPNVFITQHIASGFGHLKQLGIVNFDNKTQNIINKAINFLDNEIVDIYNKLLKEAHKIKEKKGQIAYQKYLDQKHISYFTLQYLYMRSFYQNLPIKNSTQKAIAYYKKQSVTYWNSFNLSGKGQIALIHHRTGNKAVATKILASLKETSIVSEELGMYWKENTTGWFWHQAPIETQALLIEAFAEIENNTEVIDNLKIWLLKHKQVNRWKTTKATTEAIYALLLQGSDWISVTDMVNISVGNKKIDPANLPNVKVEAGTGYFKTSWKGGEITPTMGKVSINAKGKTISWGGLYWQYFENLDKITTAKTPLQLNKKIFKKINTDSGKKLIEIKENNAVQVGDLITIRIELRVDRSMEFIHMKDMRASGFEPVNVISKYKWQDGLGYYQSTKDAATNFFFDRLPKGVYVFEYTLRANNAGSFSNGITSIQNMYAPEFSSHSEGKRVIIKE